jgi:hypothetical protein
MDAPEDDEPLDALEIAAIEEGRQDIARGDTIPWDEVKKGFLMKEKFTALVAATNNSDEPNKYDDLQVVEDFFADCDRYVATVVAMEAAILTSRDQMTSREYREYISQLDSSRHNAHNALIASVKILGRLCQLYQVEPIYDGPDERVPIAEFAMEVVGEMFLKRKL